MQQAIKGGLEMSKDFSAPVAHKMPMMVRMHESAIQKMFEDEQLQEAYQKFKDDGYFDQILENMSFSFFVNPDQPVDYNVLKIGPDYCVKSAIVKFAISSFLCTEGSTGVLKDAILSVFNDEEFYEWLNQLSVNRMLEANIADVFEGTGEDT